jgi:cytochrome c556
MSSRSKVRPMAISLTLAALLTPAGCRSAPEQPPAPPASIDPRTPVPLPAEAQQAVLREMRQLLGAVGGALAGAANGDTASVIAALAPAGSAAAADPALEALLPAGWKELAERTHSDFDSLVAAVRRTRGSQALKDTVLVRLARLSGGCAACHETYRVTIQ